jgi:NAD+ diphosphatase
MTPDRPIFTGATLDRASKLRTDPAAVAALLADPTSVVVGATADGVVIERSGGPMLRRTPLDAIEPPILLGLENGRAVFAADVSESTDDLVSLREAGEVLPQAEGGLAAYAVALLNWHRRHRFCANCGAETAIAEAGLSRKCPNCRATHFPRTDPVVIMVVAHGTRLLLGRRSGWPANRYSVLAGFVSPGETPEEAVVREVREESGIEAYGARYITSQPWPFPASLMLGFEASANGGEPEVCDDELEAVGWFTLDQVTAAQREEGELRLPPSVSIARTLINGWVARISGSNA